MAYSGRGWRGPRRTLTRAVLVGGGLGFLAVGSAALAHWVEGVDATSGATQSRHAAHTPHAAIPVSKPAPARRRVSIPPVQSAQAPDAASPPEAPPWQPTPAEHTALVDPQQSAAMLQPAYVEVAAALERVRGAAANTRAMLEEPSNQGDAVRLACIRDRLLQLEAIEAELERARSTLLLETVTEKERQTARTLARRSLERAVTLAGEAAGCAGVVEGVQIEVTIDGESPVPGAMDIPDPVFVPERPPAASPSE